MKRLFMVQHCDGLILKHVVTQLRHTDVVTRDFEIDSFVNFMCIQVKSVHSRCLVLHANTLSIHYVE